MNYILGGILIAVSVVMIVAVLFQQGKNRKLSGAISGGSSDTYFGKSKTASRDKKLSALTTVMAVIFAVVVLVMYLMQDNGESSYVPYDPTVNVPVSDVVEGEDTTAPEADVNEGAEDTTAESDAE